MNLFSKCLCALAVMVAADHALADPILTDGGFEAPFVANGSSVQSGGTGWTSSTTAAVYIEANGTALGDTPFGRQYLALTATATNAQTVSGFLAGGSYQFSLQLADIAGDANPLLMVVLSGAATASQSYTPAVGGPYGTGNIIPFVGASFNFVPTTSGSVTFTLVNASTTGAVAVDNVAIAVPEPSDLALVLAFGAMAVAFCKSRLRQA